MTLHRAVAWLHTYGRRYPSAWTDYARLLADPPTEWPTWCWCPLAGAYAVISRGRDRIRPDEAADIGTLGAIAAWRATQGIYRVHPSLLAELLETPLTGDVPAEILTRLPEWSVYVETPGHALWGAPLAGFWGYLEHDVSEGRTELRLVLDFEDVDQLGQVVVHLGASLEDGVRAAVVDARIQALRMGRAHLAPPLDGVEVAAQGIAGLVSTLLYLCADDAEIGARAEAPPRVVRAKKRPILPSPKAPVIHETGTRIGAALDLARERVAREHGPSTGRSVSPHVRRAHWHSYLMGPLTAERRRVLRWLSPMLVAADDAPNVATVRKVPSADESP